MKWFVFIIIISIMCPSERIITRGKEWKSKTNNLYKNENN